MNTRSLLQTGALALALTAIQLPAAVIFDTLPNPTIITTIRIDPGYVAQSFTVGATSYNLSSVVLSLGAKEVHSGGTFFVELLDATGAGHTPGAVLKTLTGNTDPATAGQYTFTRHPPPPCWQRIPPTISQPEPLPVRIFTDGISQRLPAGRLLTEWL